MAATSSSGPGARWHPVLRVALYLPATGIAAALLSLPFFTAWSLLAPLVDPLLATLPATSAEPSSALPGALVFLTASLLVTTVFRRYVDGASLRSLGLELRSSTLVQLAAGFALGAVLMVLVLAVELLLGAYRLVATNVPPPAGSGLLELLLASFALFAIVGFYEELLLRGYVLQNLMVAWRTLAAVVVSSLLFALLHLFNPGANVVSVLGLLFAGILLAAAYLASGRLWMPIGLHWSWNFVQGPVLGFPVSGLEVGGLLVLEPVGPPLLTGERFGPEASLVGIGVEIVGILLLWGWSTRARHQDRITQNL